MNKLPSNWCWTKFNELAINYDGERIPLKSSDRNLRQGIFPYYGASGIIDYIDDYIFDGQYLLIAEDGANLISRSTPIAFEAHGKFWVNNHAHIIQVFGNLIPLAYLSCYINTIDLKPYISGSAQPKLNQKNLNRLKIPLPPLNEQKRIVTKIEALQTKSDRAKQQLKQIKPLLNQFRQSVLAAAFRGDLTKNWREQNINTFWENTTLGNVIKDKPRNGYSPKAVDYPTQVKSFSLSATTSGIFKPEHFKYIDKEIEQDSYLWLKPGDILIQRSNTLEYVGTAAIYTGQFGDFIYPDTIMKIQINGNKTNNKFIYYSLSNKKTRQYFKDNATGTAGNMPKINQNTVMNTPVSLPSIEEQKEIVRRIESLFNLADNIEQQYQQAETNLETLNQSILAKAFRGELVPQDPNDEPASVLLERIKAERSNQEITGKKAKKKDSK
ncbi:MAG: restriction endonuclease subunit S [Xenococcaceae cyanobacterium]